MGINQVEGVLTEFGSLIPGLQAKRFDIIAAGMYVTPERCRQAAFSNPTYGVSQALLVKQGNPKNLHSYEDAARNPNARLGVVVGAIESDYAASLKVPPDRTIVFPDAVSALAGVQAGRADAYAATALTVNDLMGKAGATAAWKGRALHRSGDRRQGRARLWRLCLPQGRPGLVDAFNAELAKFLGTEEHKKLVAPFGFTAEELPKGMTAAKLCARASEGGAMTSWIDTLGELAPPLLDGLGVTLQVMAGAAALAAPLAVVAGVGRLSTRRRCAGWPPSTSRYSVAPPRWCSCSGSTSCCRCSACNCPPCWSASWCWV